MRSVPPVGRYGSLPRLCPPSGSAQAAIPLGC